MPRVSQVSTNQGCSGSTRPHRLAPHAHPTGAQAAKLLRKGAVLLAPPVRRSALVGGEPSLIHALDQVTAAWREMTTQGELSEQTYDKFSQLLQRFARYMSLRGAVLLADATAHLTEDFVTARGRTRHGLVSESAPATQNLRRSVVRAAFRTMHDLGLTEEDPTRHIVLAGRTPGTVRPLSEDEAMALRHHASFFGRPTRHAAAAALALAGGHSGEIGHSRVQDLDVKGARVWMHGSTKTDPRWCPLDPWALNALTERARFVAAQQLRPYFAPAARLAVSTRPASDAALQARVCVALGDLLRRIGVESEHGVKPASVTARAGVDVFESTGRIEDVARRLGLRSLDRAAAVVGFDWSSTPTDEHSDRDALQGPEQDCG